MASAGDGQHSSQPDSNSDATNSTTETTLQQQQQQQQIDETNSSSTAKSNSQDSNQDEFNEQRLIELEEERKLRLKNPSIQRPGSEFLQKRLQRGLKYFDSGDYNMAKASTNPNIKLPEVAATMPAIDSKILNKRH